MHQESDLSRTRIRVVCGILLSATLINYACRMPFTQNSVEIKAAFGADGYGTAEGLFGLGFACGGLLFGLLADVVNVRWLYPLVMIAWALAGATTAYVDSLSGLCVSRFALGLFEAGHWPCTCGRLSEFSSRLSELWATACCRAEHRWEQF